jgi:hypothetical protein
MKECFSRCQEKLGDSSCKQIQEAYAKCLMGPDKEQGCETIRIELEKCTADEIGKLN